MLPFIATAVLIGTLMPLQAVINALLGRELASPVASAFVSFLGGTIVLAVIAFTRPAAWARLPQLPPWLWSGGLLGAIFVAAALILVPKIGATSLMAAFVTGQLIMSLAMDHYGWLGLPVRTLDMTRVLGVVLLAAGIFLVTRPTHAP